MWTTGSFIQLIVAESQRLTDLHAWPVSGSGLPRGRGHGPFAQKGPLENLWGRDKKRAVRGREGAVKVWKNLRRGRKRFLKSAIHPSPPPPVRNSIPIL